MAFYDEIVILMRDRCVSHQRKRTKGRAKELIRGIKNAIREQAKKFNRSYRWTAPEVDEMPVIHAVCRYFQEREFATRIEGRTVIIEWDYPPYIGMRKKEEPA